MGEQLGRPAQEEWFLTNEAILRALVNACMRRDGNATAYEIAQELGFEVRMTPRVRILDGEVHQRIYDFLRRSRDVQRWGPGRRGFQSWRPMPWIKGQEA